MPNWKPANGKETTSAQPVTWENFCIILRLAQPLALIKVPSSGTSFFTMNSKTMCQKVALSGKTAPQCKQMNRFLLLRTKKRQFVLCNSAREKSRTLWLRPKSQDWQNTVCVELVSIKKTTHWQTTAQWQNHAGKRCQHQGFFSLLNYLMFVKKPPRPKSPEVFRFFVLSILGRLSAISVLWHAILCFREADKIVFRCPVKQKI